MKAIRLWAKQTVSSRFPRRIYLMDSLEEIGRAFPTCWVFPRVDWQSFRALNSFMTEIGVTKGDYTYAVVPLHLLPVKNEPTFQIKNKVFEKFLPSLRGYSGGEPLEVARVLYSALENVFMFVNGQQYETPCEMCHDYMNHVYGKCALVDKDSKTHCHASLVFDAKKVLETETTE